MRILVAEDEKPLARAIVKILEKNNFTADSVGNGSEALDYLALGTYDALILDIMMPVTDGITALKKLRQSGNNLPVLILSAKSETQDRVTGLDCGADYYLTKPFDSTELLAALRAITRPKDEKGAKLCCADTSLDRTTYELSTKAGSYRLANKEYQLMELFMSNPGRIFSADCIYDRIWGLDGSAETSVVWVYISYLRKKLTALSSDVRIVSSRNAGYSLEVEK